MVRVHELLASAKTKAMTPFGKAVAVATSLLLVLITAAAFSHRAPIEDDVEAVRKPDVAPKGPMVGEREARGKEEVTERELKGKEPEPERELRGRVPEKELRGKLEDAPLTVIPAGPSPETIWQGDSSQSHGILNRVTRNPDGSVTVTLLIPPSVSSPTSPSKGSK